MINTGLRGAKLEYLRIELLVTFCNYYCRMPFIFSIGLPTIFHIFGHNVPMEERSRAFGYLVAAGSVGQTVASVVSHSRNQYVKFT
jgi:hypothetical protein